MKYITSLKEFEYNTFFCHVKTVYEYTLLVLAVLEKMVISRNEHKISQGAYILLDENALPNRIFIISKIKIESFVFDFNIELGENEIPSISVGQYLLSPEIISCAKLITLQFIRLDRNWINERDNDLNSEYSQVTLDASYYLIKHIIYSESSYLRYDYDPKHADGNKHPKHHLDINYSKDGSYKIGIISRARTTDINYIMDLLSKESDCHMLQYNTL